MNSTLTRWQANALLLLAAAIWGSAFIGQVLGMAGMGPFGFTAVRFALGALVVAPLAWREWRALRRAGHAADRRDAATIALLGTLTCAGVLLQQIGLQSTSVTHAGFLTAIYVPLVPLLGWWLHRRAPHASVWPAVAGCLAGTWLLTGGGLPSAGSGDAWVLASAFPWAVQVLLVGHAANRLRGPFVLACGQFTVCALLSLALAASNETISVDGLRLAAGAIVYTGILSVGLGLTLQVVAQRAAHPAEAAIILSSETVFAALFGAWFFDERLSAQGWAGCALILASILLVELLPTARPRLAPR